MSAGDFRARLNERMGELRCREVDGAEWIDGFQAGAQAALELAAEELEARLMHPSCAITRAQMIETLRWRATDARSALLPPAERSEVKRED